MYRRYALIAALFAWKRLEATLESYRSGTKAAVWPIHAVFEWLGPVQQWWATVKSHW